MKRGILFDLDGTLWDSSEEVAVSWLMALEDVPEYAGTVTREAVQSVMGKPMNEIADILFARETQERRMGLLAHCMEVENEYIRVHGGQLMPGLLETLAELKRECHLYIVSNCQTGYIEAFLEHHGLGSFFDDYESYGGTGKTKGENIRLVAERNGLDAAVYVGDTQGDYDAALFAGIPFIHARTGYGTVDGEPPYVESLSQLPQVVEEVFRTMDVAGS